MRKLRKNNRKLRDTMDYSALYQQKKGSVQDALNFIQSGMTVYFASDCNEPIALLKQLHTVAPRVHDVLCYKSRLGPYPFMGDPALRGHIRYTNFFYGAGWQDGHKQRIASYTPTDLCDFAPFVSRSHPGDVFIAAVSPMDDDGNFCIGLSLMSEWETSAVCKDIIVEVNPNLPKVDGGLLINIRDVALLYESNEPIPEVHATEPNETEIKIAQYCRELIHDGDCIQLGIGSLPNALAVEMMDLHDLGLHTEMFTTKMGEMIRKGVVTGARKNIDTGRHVGGFAGGDRALYDTLASDPACLIRPTSYVNNPFIIAQIDNFVSVNTCIEMDLTGQVCSESIGTRQISGTGGSIDFAYGATHAKGGRSILAFTSTAKHGESKIRCTLTPGAQVSIPRSYVDYIVTEYGIANLRGKMVCERVEALIAIAHPDYRAELRKQAEELFYI